MSLTDIDCKVKTTRANNDIEGCTAAMMHCDNFDPEVQIEHNHIRGPGLPALTITVMK